MWLINTSTHRLEEFYGSNIPPYAILSHTWGSDEVSFKEFREFQERESNGQSSFIRKAGYQKVINACEQSLRQGIAYCWCDTCCIDKSSSTELQEAINSMFQWYASAKICFVYLQDFIHQQDKDVDISKCRWFTRGWCLQELIAPRDLQFFDSSWSLVAQKHDLIRHLCTITDIEEEVLSGECPLSQLTIARRLSWAANRQTTRTEDQAYCMLGILDINMPMLYGEGHKAFQRLQQEILRAHDDPSIFAWQSKSATDLYQDMLAPSICCFANCGNIRKRPTPVSSGMAFSNTSRGIRVTSPGLLTTQKGDCAPNVYRLQLRMIWNTTRHNFYLVTLIKVAPGIYVRLNAPCLRGAVDCRGYHDPLGSDDEIYIIPANALLDQTKVDPGINPFRVECRGSLPDLSAARKQEVEPRRAWDSANSRFFMSRTNTSLGYIRLYPNPEEGQVSAPWFVLAVRLCNGSAMKWYLVASDIWKLHENCKNSSLVMKDAVKHEGSIELIQSGIIERYQVGSLVVFVTLARDFLSISC